MNISVGDIHNDMIKPYNNGGLESVFDSLTYKVLISDTKLRSFIPPQARKMTPILRQICGCGICIAPKGIQIDLNIFRKIFYQIFNRNMVGYAHATVHIVLQVLLIKKIKCFQMVNFYMLLSNIQLSESHVLLLNQIILFI